MLLCPAFKFMPFGVSLAGPGYSIVVHKCHRGLPRHRQPMMAAHLLWRLNLDFKSKALDGLTYATPFGQGPGSCVLGRTLRTEHPAD